MTTQVPVAKQALFNAVRNQITDPSVLLVWTQPVIDHPGDIVALGDVERTAKPIVMIGSGGAGWIEEEFHITTIVSVFRAGDDFEGTEWHAWDLLDAIENAVRIDPSLAGTVIVAEPTDSHMKVAWTADHKGILAEGEIVVRCVART